MRTISIKVHSIKEDGLPEMDSDSLTGRVALIFNGCVVSGWPLDPVGCSGEWEGNNDVSHGRRFADITHWIEFPIPVWDLEEEAEAKPNAAGADTAEEQRRGSEIHRALIGYHVTPELASWLTDLALRIERLEESGQDCESAVDAY